MIRTKIMVAITLLVLFWTTVPISAASSLSEMLAENQPTEILTQPIKTYYLNVLPEVGRREVKFDLPATNIAVTSQSGDTTVRCGDAINSYSCSPGKRLELRYDPTVPLIKFWAENTTATPVRLQIDIYEVVIENP